LRVVFFRTRNFPVIAFTDANMYATSMTQRNVLKATVPDGMVGLPKPAYVFAAVRLSKALKDARSKAVAYAENFHGGCFKVPKFFFALKSQV